MLISSFRKKITSVNSQLSNEINYKILFRSLEHVLFCSDRSVGQCLQTSNEASTASSMLSFESLFPVWKWLLSKEKFRNFYFEIEF